MVSEVRCVGGDFTIDKTKGTELACKLRTLAAAAGAEADELSHLTMPSQGVAGRTNRDALQQAVRDTVKKAVEVLQGVEGNAQSLVKLIEQQYAGAEKEAVKAIATTRHEANGGTAKAKEKTRSYVPSARNTAADRVSGAEWFAKEFESWSPERKAKWFADRQAELKLPPKGAK